MRYTRSRASTVRVGRLQSLGELARGPFPNKCGECKPSQNPLALAMGSHQVQETLPHPSVHLVIEKDQSKVYGVVTRKFARLLENKGRAFGIKFKPGAFYPFVKSPVSRFTNATISFWDAFGLDGQALEEAILSQEDEGELIALAEKFLRERLPEQDKN